MCLVFPVLAYDLYELLKNEKFGGVSIKLVRKFGVQILHTLNALANQKVRLIHCDLKPGEFPCLAILAQLLLSV